MLHIYITDDVEISTDSDEENSDERTLTKNSNQKRF